MTDTPQTPTADAANGPGAGARTAPQIQISAQYVKDLSFENPNAPQSLMAGQPAPQVAVNVDVRTNQINDTSWEVVLTIRGEAKANDRQTFLVELAYAGVATLTGVSKEQTAPLLLIEVPRLLFPFARSVIAEATRNGGFPPLLVQPIDFADLFRRQLQSLRERQQASAGAETPKA